MKTLKAILILALVLGVPGLALGQAVWQHLMFAVKPCAVCNDPYQQQLAPMATTASGVAGGQQAGTQWHVVVPLGYSGVGGTPIYAATWDGVSSCVNVTVGSISGINMAYLGWPMVAC